VDRIVSRRPLTAATVEPAVLASRVRSTQAIPEVVAASAEGPAGPALADLYFQEGEWRPLPDWGKFFIRLGSLVAEFSAADERLIIGVAVPTRAFAATLVAVGAVACLSGERASAPDSQHHFRALCKLPTGTAVTYRRGNKLLRGLILGHVTLEGGEYLSLMVGSGEKLLLNPILSMKVQLAARQFTQVSAKQHGLEILQHGTFLRATLPEVDPYYFAMQSRFDCLLNGNVGLLRHEITLTPFGAYTGSGKLTEGTLQDLLRVRRFFGADHHFRSEVFSSARAKSDSNSIRDDSPPLVVFDGASAFLKWRHEWEKSAWIAILDRTSMLTLAAADTLNQHYAEQRLSDWQMPNDLSVPPGIEVTGYVVRKT